ncbi:hypothetical protein WA026_010231 [Henosepilachna vigintioctopunctata]|uniref:Uncharacterized protein n=1 Tax=Henosepilachna vigintioctopunctata TaxID=420089 RepID=A0AAW1U9M7_9CUCU
MTAEIFQLINVRRDCKSNDQQKYENVQRKIRKRYERQKKWLEEKCAEIEQLQNRSDNFNVFKKGNFLMITEDPETENPTVETGPKMTKDEVEHETKSIKSGKADGPGKLPAGIFKLIDDTYIHIITNLFNRIYRTGIIPK